MRTSHQTTAIRLLYVTCPDLATATVIANAVVDARLAACANLLPGMRSVYRWQGTVEHAEEVVMILKTTTTRIAKLMTRIRALHPYEVPCIVVLPISAGYAPFLAWIAAETAPASVPDRRHDRTAKPRRAVQKS